MSGNGNQPRPARTLTVENFSVIKYAKIEFSKITVLIGPQSSGKSLLCKIAYFLSAEIPILAVETALSPQSWVVFESFVVQRFREWFPLEGWGLDPIRILFEACNYSIELTGSRRDAADQRLEVRFSQDFMDLYSELARETSQPKLAGPPQLQSGKDWAWARVMRLFDSKYVYMPTYVPAGRTLFVNSATGFAALQNPEIDQTVRLFAKEIVWNTRSWLPGTLSSGRGITQDISRGFEHLLGGHVATSGSTPEFRASDGRALPLSFLSSGTQEMLPLFNVLERLAYWQEHRAVYNSSSHQSAGTLISPGETIPVLFVEEPDAHIFPSTQFEIVRLFAWLSSDSLLRFSWIITTHSPYILSAFNDLIEAGRLGVDKNLRAEVNDVIPEKYWIKPGDFKAYSIHDGKLESIMDKETGLINGEYLDAISNKIGGDFDALLRIGYAKS